MKKIVVLLLALFLGANTSVYLSFAQEGDSPGEFVPYFHLPGEGAAVVNRNSEPEPLVYWGLGLIQDVTWLSDDTIALSSEGVGTWVYNINNPDVPIRLMPALKGRLLVSPDGKWITSTPIRQQYGDERSIEVWNAQTSQLHAAVYRGQILKEGIVKVEWTPDGRLLYVTAGRLALWDIATKSAPIMFVAPQELGYNQIWGAEISPDGSQIAVFVRKAPDWETAVLLWDIAKDEQRILFETNREDQPYFMLHQMGFSPDGNEFFMLANQDSERLELWRWAVPSGEMLSTAELDCTPEADVGQDYGFYGWKKILLEEDLLVCGDRSYRKEIIFLRLSTGEMLSSTPFYVEGLDWDRSHGLLTAFGFNYRPSNAAMLERYAMTLWDLRSGQPYAELIGHRGWVTGVAVSPNGRLMASGGNDGKLHIWDIQEKALRTTIQRGYTLSVIDLELSSDGRYLVGVMGAPGIYAPHNEIKISAVTRWNLATAEMEIVMETEAAPRPTDAIYSPDGRFLLIGYSGGNITMLDAESMEEKRIISNIDGVEKMVFSTDGRLLAVASRTNIRIWNMETFQTVNVVRHHENTGDEWSFGFSSNGGWLKLGIRIWKVENGGRLMAAWDGKSPGQGWQGSRPTYYNLISWSTVFAMNERYVVIGAQGGVIMIYPR